MFAKVFSMNCVWIDQVYGSESLYLSVVTTKCDAGNQGAAGVCNCINAKGWIEGIWRKPWCHEGKCYTGQAYDKCIGKPNGKGLGDGTWCWNEERNTGCPVKSGKIT